MQPDRDVLSDQGAAEGYVPLRWVEEANAERDRLMVENARLREALEYIAHPPTSSTFRQDRLALSEVARSALQFDEQNVEGAQASVEITARSWDPAAAGRRAVEKHGDALKRLSDEGASDA